MSDPRRLPAWAPTAAVAAALVALIAASFAERWEILSASPFPIGIDGYFYPIQLRSLLETGALHYPSAPLTLWLMAPLAAATDPITGAKLGAALFGALIALPAYGLGARLGGGRGAGLLAAVLATRSAGSAHLTFEYVKNGIALTVALAALWLLLRALETPTRGRAAAAVLGIAAAVLSHKMAAGLVVVVGIPALIAGAAGRGRLRGRRLLYLIGGLAAACAIVAAIGLLAPRRLLSPADAALFEGLLTADARWNAPAYAGRGGGVIELGHEALIACWLAIAAALARTRLGGRALEAATHAVIPREHVGPPGSGPPPADVAAGWTFAAIALAIGLPWLDVSHVQGLGFRLRIAAFVPLALITAMLAGRVLAWIRHRDLALAALALALAPAAASADDLALSVFDPVPATVSDGFQLQSPEVGQSGDWALAAVVSHATDPLILDGIANGVFLDDYAVISRSTVTNLGGAIAFLGRFEAGARIPLYVQEGQPPGNPIEEFTGQPADGTARGDLALSAKARLVRKRLAGDGAFLVGLGAGLTLPTATAGRFTGGDAPSGRVQVLGSLVPGAFERRVTLTMNLGGVIRARRAYANLEQKSGVAWGLGLTVRALDNVWLAGEVYGDTVPAGRTDEMTRSQVLSPIEWLAGVRWKPDHRFTVGLAAGRGLTSAVGTPAFRGVLALTLTPGAPELRPIRIPKPDGDADGDGVRDSADRCPGEREDADLFDDTDGCLDEDNDGDGIADAQDRCPIEAEDADGVEDTDGCIDKDNDGDRIADALDRCPMQAEDADLFDDTDGCPDPDNDRDGVLDAADRCPTSPETINGKDDNDGCPDRGDSLVVLSPDRLELLDLIQFTAAQKIAKASQNLLAQVGAMMRARTEIVRLRITVHVQPTDDPDRDQALSDQRAAAVREWLVQWGVAPERLEARGFGGTKPLVPPDKKGAAALNQRVELIILERK